MRILCTGAESSGTRLLTRLVAGFEGVTAAEHRSLPHAGEWPTHEYAREFDVVLVSVRSMYPTGASAAAAGHVLSPVHAHENMRAAWRWVADLMGQHPLVGVVTYEDVCERGLQAVGEALLVLGVPRPWSWQGVEEPLENANGSWSNLTVEVGPSTGRSAMGHDPFRSTDPRRHRGDRRRDA